MRNLLIVDDEKNIQNGLKAIIEREFPGHYAITLAANGAEALAIMEQQQMDLMITDIRMPVMDGIELIHRTQELPQKPEVMILSGYDDFQYAKEAVRCEVRMYLLKPIVREELFEGLRQLESRLVRKEEQSQRFEAYARQSKEHTEVQLNYLFVQPVLGKQEVEKQLQSLGLYGLEDGYQLALLHWSDVDLARHDEKHRLGYIDDLITELGAAACQRTLRFFNKNSEMIILTGSREMLPHLTRRIYDKGSMCVKVGFSRWVTSLGDMQECYKQADKALKYTIFHSYPAFVAYEAIVNKQQAYTLPIQSIKKMANMLGTDRHEEFKQLCKEVLDLNTIMEYDISYMEGISQAFNELLFDHVFNVYGEESVEILRLYKRVVHMHNFQDFHDYFHHVVSLLDKLNAYVSTMKLVHNDHRDMKKAIQYIHDNYNKDLNMAMVSNHVSLNYTYFSQAFKNYTKESFVHYIKRVRVDKAKELLLNTELKVMEIGMQIGFENVKHFHRVFRELEGISPNEYRKAGFVSNQ